MQVLREFPSDKEFSAILRADVLCSHRIVANGDIFEVSGRTIPGWLVAISFGVVAVVAVLAPFFCTFGAVLGVLVGLTLPVAATLVWTAVSCFNRTMSERPFLVFHRRTQMIQLRFEDVTLAGGDVVALHILNGWYRFENCWKVARVSELSIVVQEHGEYHRYHALSGNGISVWRVAKALSSELDVCVMRPTLRSGVS